jgi:type II secretory ATPase GspE/PulE/Tfp pilus assembly ATPase PilB-like protein
MMPPPPALFPLIINRLKTMAGMDTNESRLPQTGRILLRVDKTDVDLRVSTVPVFNGERLVVRILRPIDLVDLPLICGDAHDKLDQLQSLCKLSNGIVICSGPSGSGKTTLVYAMVKELNQPRRCVISIEDPVEFTLPGIAQIEVKPQGGMSFSHALRHVLRQDPDVLVLGEVRDLETLQAAVVAANTGHLVLTSIHGGSATGTLKRILDAGLEPFMVNSSVAAVVSQRLVRQLCPTCRQKAQPALHSLPPDAVEMIKRAENATFCEAITGRNDCPHCHGTGYRGRLALHEILVMNDPVRQAIAAGADVTTIRTAAIQSGMKTLLMDGMRLAATGQTSVEEVMRVTPVGLLE